MNRNFDNVISCKWCAWGSEIFGHGLTKLLGKKWDKITIEDVAPSLEGLNLEIVGGLRARGYTEHDIDVIGEERDIPVLVKKLNERNVYNLVHYCGPKAKNHSHWTALKNGFLVTFFGNKKY